MVVPLWAALFWLLVNPFLRGLPSLHARFTRPWAFLAA